MEVDLNVIIKLQMTENSGKLLKLKKNSGESSRRLRKSSKRLWKSSKTASQKLQNSLGGSKNLWEISKNTVFYDCSSLFENSLKF
jgi:hypothetical protein